MKTLERQTGTISGDLKLNVVASLQEDILLNQEIIIKKRCIRSSEDVIFGESLANAALVCGQTDRIIPLEQAMQGFVERDDIRLGPIRRHVEETSSDIWVLRTDSERRTSDASAAQMGLEGALDVLSRARLHKESQYATHRSLGGVLCNSNAESDRHCCTLGTREELLHIKDLMEGNLRNEMEQIIAGNRRISSSISEARKYAVHLAAAVSHDRVKCDEAEFMVGKSRDNLLGLRAGNRDRMVKVDGIIAQVEKLRLQSGRLIESIETERSKCQYISHSRVSRIFEIGGAKAVLDELFDTVRSEEKNIHMGRESFLIHVSALEDERRTCNDLDKTLYSTTLTKAACQVKINKLVNLSMKSVDLMRSLELQIEIAKRRSVVFLRKKTSPGGRADALIRFENLRKVHLELTHVLAFLTFEERREDTKLDDLSRKIREMRGSNNSLTEKVDVIESEIRQIDRSGLNLAKRRCQLEVDLTELIGSTHQMRAAIALAITQLFSLKEDASLTDEKITKHARICNSQIEQLRLASKDLKDQRHVIAYGVATRKVGLHQAKTALEHLFQNRLGMGADDSHNQINATMKLVSEREELKSEINGLRESLAEILHAVKTLETSWNGVSASHHSVEARVREPSDASQVYFLQPNYQHAREGNSAVETCHKSLQVIRVRLINHLDKSPFESFAIPSTLSTSEL